MNVKKFFKNTWSSVEILGAGSFGTVYKAKKNDSEEYSAIKQIEIPHNKDIIKELQNEGLTFKEITDSFALLAKSIVKEIEIMYKLKGVKNVVQIEDYELLEIETPQREISKKYVINIRMELLQGLDTKLNNEHFNDIEALKLGIDLATCLIACEEKNIIHRDIKIDNIFVDDEGHYKLGDFGEAKVLENTLSSMTRRGTENYMAPEIYKGENANQTVDIYSLGMVLYRLFNNRKVPFLNPNGQDKTYEEREEALKRRITGEEIPAPSQASSSVSTIILKCLEYNPENRYQTANELKKDLENVIGDFTEPTKLFTTNEEVNECSNDVINIIRIVELSESELSNGCTKKIKIGGKLIDVTIPADSEDKDEIIVDSEVLEANGINRQVKVTLILGLLVAPVSLGAATKKNILDENLSDEIGGESNINSESQSSSSNVNHESNGNVEESNPSSQQSSKNTTDSNKNNHQNHNNQSPSNNPKANPEINSQTTIKTPHKLSAIIGGGILITALIILLVQIINPDKEVKQDTKENKESTPIYNQLWCEVTDTSVDNMQKTEYYFSFDDEQNNLEAIIFRYDNSVFTEYDTNMDNELNKTLQGYCESQIVNEKGCSYSVKDNVAQMDGDLYPKQFIKYLESYGFKQGDDTLLNAIQKYFESEELEYSYQDLFSISFQGGGIYEATCKVSSK